jgi:hypothetical protein
MQKIKDLIFNLRFFNSTSKYSEQERSFYLRSPSGYKFLRRKLNNCLPSPSSIRNWKLFTFVDAGKVFALEEKLKAFTTTLGEKEKNCVLIFDELSVSPHLEYDQLSDKIIGNIIFRYFQMYPMIMT